MPSVHKLEDFLEEFVLFVFAVMMMMVVVATMALLLLLFRFWSLVLYGPGEPWTPYLAEEYLEPSHSPVSTSSTGMTGMCRHYQINVSVLSKYSLPPELYSSPKACIIKMPAPLKWLFNLSTRFLSLFCVAITNKIPVSGYLRSQDVYLSRNSGVERSKECVLASW